MVLPCHRRQPGHVPARHQAGSLYWLGDRDAEGDYLNGSNTYTLTVPLPVPEKLFWSVTVYDARTRSQIRTDQNKAVLGSLFDFHDVRDASSIDLTFGPAAPAEHRDRWVQTLPDVGWFVYLRLYGPETAAFDGTWQLPDFQRNA